MTEPLFTVLIPSHSHGPLLELAVESVLRQSVSEFEIFVVLDGPDDDTRDAALRLATRDGRVRVYDNPKGKGAGEAHRAAALEEARGRFVAYLSDDDLWLPHHLAHLADRLERSDFVAAQTVFHAPDGQVYLVPGDVGDPVFRSRLLEDPPWNFIGLSQGSHSIEAYRRLERGWHPAPTGIWSDLHMWRHFLSHAEVTAASAAETTVFTFPSPKRAGMTLSERHVEMGEWLTLIGQPDRLADFMGSKVASKLRWVAAREAAGRMEAEARIEVLADELEGVRTELVRLRSELERIRSSPSFRAVRRLAAIPVVGWVGRRVAGWLSRR